MMAAATTSVQGDTWDTIAKRIYGDELKTQILMEARKNIRLLDIQVFPAGVVVATPDPTEEPASEDLPDWRK